MKGFIAAAAIAAIFAVPVYAADGVTYTFNGVNIITDGSTNDITDVKLTDDITVTTSGDMNRKYAAVTDLEHNSEVGTFPAEEEFKADGSYIYLATASSNDNTIITLNMPEIEKGSKVTLTFAKPVVTNNGSTLRNTNDPYAYFQIADRYISLNGDNFNEWRTESVVTGEDTDEIVFHCDKWGAVAISSIEVSEGNGAALYSLDITSNRYANINVNGIRFFTDETGKLTVPSLPEGEELTVTAEKGGYTSAEKSIMIGSGTNSLDMQLECETDSVYYETDFSGGAGALALEGSYETDTETKDVTSFRSNVTFSEGGVLYLNDQAGDKILTAEYKGDGIYVNGKIITVKDNMEFEAVLDKAENDIVIIQNAETAVIDQALENTEKIASVSGSGVSLEYIDISYPDMTAIAINGPDRVPVSEGHEKFVQYEAVSQYMRPGTRIVYSVDGSEGVSIDETGLLSIGQNASGTINIRAEYNGATENKQVELVPDPVIKEWSAENRTLQLGTAELFGIENCVDENGENVEYTLKDFASSDESVIRINENGVMNAVGAGTAVISANAYTGADNPVSVEYTVDKFYSGGVTEGTLTYAPGSIAGDNIKGYRVYYSDGTYEEAKLSQIPAAAAASDGMLVTVMYNAEGKLVSVACVDVKEGEKLPVSNGSRHEYLKTGSSFEELTTADTEMSGFELSHAAGQLYEVVPVYIFESIGDVKEEGKLLSGSLADGYYDITFKKAEAARGDIYVNGYMVGNNVDQADADRKVTEGALYTAEDIKIEGGSLSVSMCDGSTMLDYAEAVKKPEFCERPQRLYIIGDSLVCEYYGSFENEVGGGRSGWGQQIDDYVNIPVTNLANSGQYAAGLYATAFPSVTANGEPGDILLIECAYNDRSYSTREEMTECVKAMIAQCREKDITPILVTPNASAHDYKPSVVWSSYLKDIAIDTDCECIDLSQESYDFLYSLYGDDKDGNITKIYNLTENNGDNLHSSYAGAYKWASIVAQGLKDLGYDIVNTDFSYTFTDILGNEIEAGIE